MARAPSGTAGYSAVPRGSGGFRTVPALYRAVPAGNAGNRLRHRTPGFGVRADGGLPSLPAAGRPENGGTDRAAGPHFARCRADGILHRTSGGLPPDCQPVYSQIRQPENPAQRKRPRGCLQLVLRRLLRHKTERFHMSIYLYILIFIIFLALVITVGIHKKWIKTEQQTNKRIFWIGIGIALASSVFAAIVG